MIPNFNPNEWNREKILDYVIGDQPLTDQQLEFLIYFKKLQDENEELKKYCCKRNDCGGRLKENNKLTDSEVLTELEKWLWEKLNIKPANKIYASECLEKLQELKGKMRYGK